MTAGIFALVTLGEMKHFINLLGIALLCVLSSCSAIIGIFKAGMNFGIAIMVILVALIAIMIARMWKKGKL